MSYSYIIVKPSGTSEDKMLVEVIPGCAIQNVVIIEEPTPTLKDPTTIDKLFISTSNCMNFDPNFLPRRKLQVTQWFQKNFIPIQQCKDDPDSLIIMNSLKIMSPYGVDDCYTDNEVVLGKIQGLLKAMPPDVDDD